MRREDYEDAGRSNFKGELWTQQVTLDNRSYFFNVKENRMGDIFLQIVESKKDQKDSRHAIVVFEEDMRHFTKGLDGALRFIGDEVRRRFKQKNALKTKKDFREEKHSNINDLPHKTGRIHVVSKRKVDVTNNTANTNNTNNTNLKDEY